MKVFLVLFLVFLASAASASESNDDRPGHAPPQEPPSWEQILKMNQGVDVDVKNNNVVKTEIDVDTKSTSTANATAKMGNVSATAAGGTGGRGGAGGAGGNVGDINVNNGGVTIKNPRHAASAYAPAIYPSALCQGGVSVGGSSSVFGFSFGKNYTVKESCLFTLSQNCAAIGLLECSCRALMATESAKLAYGENMPSCDGYEVSVATPAPANQPSVVVVPFASSGLVTQEQLQETGKRIIETLSQK